MMDAEDLADWFIGGGDSDFGRVNGHFMESVSDLVLLTTYYENEPIDFIRHSLQENSNWDDIYEDVFTQIPGHTVFHFANMVKLRYGNTLYETMMSDIGNDLASARKLTVTGFPVYGSSRLGEKQANKLVYHTSFTISGVDGKCQIFI